MSGRLVEVLLRRAVVTVAMLFLLSVVAFLLHWQTGANAARYLFPSSQPTRAQLEAGAHTLGIDRPLVRQYRDFLRDAVRGDLGLAWTGISQEPDGSLVGTPVRRILRQASGPTVSLVAGGAALLLIVAVPLALLAASRPRSLLDRTSLAVVLAGVSVPPIVVALVLQNLAAEHWSSIPSSGYCPLVGSSADLDTTFFTTSLPRAVGTAAPCGGVVDWASHLMLPWITFAAVFAALYVRVLRANLIEVLGEAYVRAARARGAGEGRVLLRHALPNASLPLLTMVAMEGGTTLVLALYIETVYEIPGLGRLTARALSGFPSFDRPVLVGLALVVGLGVMVLNAGANAAYALIDPRAERPDRAGRLERSVI
jgi:peptide/nickel transport system permease protein